METNFKHRSPLLFRMPPFRSLRWHRKEMLSSLPTTDQYDLDGKGEEDTATKRHICDGDEVDDSKEEREAAGQEFTITMRHMHEGVQWRSALWEIMEPWRL
jgi:hypothetical protein